MRTQRFLGGAVAACVFAAAAQAGVVIMIGIDVEDNNPPQHGGLQPYVNVIQAGIAPNISNGGTKILVLGAGKNPNDDVTNFWSLMEDELGIELDFVHGAQAIVNQSFDGYGAICVVSAEGHTPSGGMTNQENAALAGRALDFSEFVLGGGGMLIFAQSRLNTPYAFMEEVFDFSVDFPSQWSQVTVTPEGEALGLPDGVLDTCCWHDEYITFPDVFDVLVTNNNTGNPCAIGGLVEPQECFLAIGRGQGADTFQEDFHTWQTQLSGVFTSFPVLLDDIPTFELPPHVVPPADLSGPGPWSFGAALPVDTITVQVLMYNPVQFPQHPEQYTQGLEVTLWSDGRLTAHPFGVRNGMRISIESYTDLAGRRFLRFPFTIDAIGG